MTYSIPIFQFSHFKYQSKNNCYINNIINRYLYYKNLKYNVFPIVGNTLLITIKNTVKITINDLL